MEHSVIVENGSATVQNDVKQAVVKGQTVP